MKSCLLDSSLHSVHFEVKIPSLEVIAALTIEVAGLEHIIRMTFLTLPVFHMDGMRRVRENRREGDEEADERGTTQSAKSAQCAKAEFKALLKTKMSSLDDLLNGVLDEFDNNHQSKAVAQPHEVKGQPQEQPLAAQEQPAELKQDDDAQLLEMQQQIEALLQGLGENFDQDGEKKDGEDGDLGMHDLLWGTNFVRSSDTPEILWSLDVRVGC